jgi:hypothetical protein
VGTTQSARDRVQVQVQVQEQQQCARPAVIIMQLDASAQLHPPLSHSYSALQDKDSQELAKLGGIHALAKMLHTDLHSGLSEGAGLDGVEAHKLGKMVKMASIVSRTPTYYRG